jgi:hypothetical protein
MGQRRLLGTTHPDVPSHLRIPLAGKPYRPREPCRSGHDLGQNLGKAFNVHRRDVAAGTIVLKRRDTGTKEVIPQTEAQSKLSLTPGDIQTNLHRKATARLKDNTVIANSIGEVEAILSDVTAENGGGKFVMAHLKDDPAKV